MQFTSEFHFQTNQSVGRQYYSNESFPSFDNLNTAPQFQYTEAEINEWNHIFPQMTLNPQEIHEFNSQYLFALSYAGPDPLVCNPPPISSYANSSATNAFTSISRSDSNASSLSSSSDSECDVSSPDSGFTPSSTIDDHLKKEISNLVGGPSNRKFINIAPYFRYSQRKAAKILGVPCSTLSKRWRDATGNKKWPYRIVSKMEKDILSLVQNLNHSGKQDPRFETKLSTLANKIEEELTPIYVSL